MFITLSFEDDKKCQYLGQILALGASEGGEGGVEFFSRQTSELEFFKLHTGST
jgi:hypothetical protein